MSKIATYYAGFFGVALVSFIVPLFVGYKAFENLQPTNKPAPNPDVSGVDHGVWDYLLKANVAGGLVDYKGMKQDWLFRDYIRQLGECDPDKLETEDEKLALACNAYNAFVINAVISHKITDNVKDFTIGGDKKNSSDEKNSGDKQNSGDKKNSGTGFFDIKEHIFAGETISLNQLEKKMIIPTFGEPRVHVALVCAALSCPSIRPEAYTGARVRDQLQDQSVQFADNPEYVMFDPATSELKLSALLAWYPGDFVQRYPNGGHLQWINESTTDPVIKDATGKAIADLAKAKGDREITISFFKYDWTLNSQANPDESDGNAKDDWGSEGGPDE